MDSGFTEIRSNLTFLRAAGYLNDRINLSIACYLFTIAIVIRDLALQSCKRKIKSQITTV